MAKPFSEQEKELIKEKLKQKGVELFGTFGIKKTNIEDITKASGIGRGTFYQFYDSKEEFFMELLDEAEQKIKSELIEIIKSSSGSPSDSLKFFLKTYLHSITEKNAILKIVINNSDEFESLIRKLPVEKLNIHTKNDQKLVVEFIKSFNDKNINILYEPDVFNGILRSIVLMSLHKSVIGEAIFGIIIDIIIDGISKSIIQER